MSFPNPGYKIVGKFIAGGGGTTKRHFETISENENSRKQPITSNNSISQSSFNIPDICL